MFTETNLCSFQVIKKELHIDENNNSFIQVLPHLTLPMMISKGNHTTIHLVCHPEGVRLNKATRNNFERSSIYRYLILSLSKVQKKKFGGKKFSLQSGDK